MGIRRRLLRSGLTAVGLSAFLFMHGTPSGASACIGGIAFDWAVAHQHGGIVQAVVESRLVRVDFSEDLVITDAKVVRDDPPLSLSVNTAAGLPCDQVADKGETIMLIYDVRGDSIRVPLYYVVEGRDALSAAVIAHGLRTAAPSTDALPPTDREHALDWLSLVILACAGTIGLALAARRTRGPGPAS